MAETKTRTTIHPVRGSASTQHGLGIQRSLGREEIPQGCRGQRDRYSVRWASPVGGVAAADDGGVLLRRQLGRYRPAALGAGRARCRPVSGRYGAEEIHSVSRCPRRGPHRSPDLKRQQTVAPWARADVAQGPRELMLRLGALDEAAHAPQIRGTEASESFSPAGFFAGCGMFGDLLWISGSGRVDRSRLECSSSERLPGMNPDVSLQRFAGAEMPSRDEAARPWPKRRPRVSYWPSPRVRRVPPRRSVWETADEPV